MHKDCLLHLSSSEECSDTFDVRHNRRKIFNSETSSFVQDTDYLSSNEVKIKNSIVVTEILFGNEIEGHNNEAIKLERTSLDEESS